MFDIQQYQELQTSGRDTTSANDGKVIEILMQTHDAFISTLRSRLTKLQVIFDRHSCLLVTKAVQLLFHYLARNGMMLVLILLAGGSTFLGKK